MECQNMEPLSVKIPVLRMECPNRGLLSVNLVILQIGLAQNSDNCQTFGQI